MVHKIEKLIKANLTIHVAQDIFVKLKGHFWPFFKKHPKWSYAGLLINLLLNGGHLLPLWTHKKMVTLLSSRGKILYVLFPVLVMFLAMRLFILHFLCCILNWAWGDLYNRHSVDISFFTGDPIFHTKTSVRYLFHSWHKICPQWQGIRLQLDSMSCPMWKRPAWHVWLLHAWWVHWAMSTGHIPGHWVTQWRRQVCLLQN